METTTFYNRITTHEVLTPRFKLSSTDTDPFEPLIPNERIWLKSKKIKDGETTMKDLYFDCLYHLYIVQLIQTNGYRERRVNDVLATSFTFTLKIIGDYREEIDDLISETIYFKEINQNGFATREIKYWETENKTITTPFNVFIIITKYASPEIYEENNDETLNAIGEITLPQPIIQPTKTPKQSIKEDKCCVCLENVPNILYVDCRHIAICNTCDKKGNFNNCPICRTQVKNNKIIL